MEIIDLTKEYERTYFLCLEEHHEQMDEAIAAKELWYRDMKGKGLRVKLGKDDHGEVGGMIQYFPIEHSWIAGKDLYFISCIWVHSNKAGAGNFQGKGMGKALLKAAVEDARSLGSKGIVAWGTSLPTWMKASWYKKQGFIQVDSKGFIGGDMLMWIPFTEDAIPPKWIKSKKKPENSSEKVKVTCMSHGWCSAMNMACSTAKNVAAEYGDKVEVEVINTSDGSQLKEWGASDLLYIDGKRLIMGPPPSKEKLRNIIEKKIRRK
ncbi:MAG: GNAT family N-acetyltransferase [Bacteroidales bacterium]|nr:GNAT family N-acetyltransferase [Bacteroidales bacterium]